jgi:ferredoxin-like protein FixX
MKNESDKQKSISSLLPGNDFNVDEIKELMEKLDSLQKARNSIIPRCLQVCPAQITTKNDTEDSTNGHSK